MTSGDACPHGTAVAASQVKGAYFGGVGTCTCCQSQFGYHHYSSYGHAGVIESDTQDETLCPPCGGQRTKYLHPDYEVVADSGVPNLTRLRRRGCTCAYRVQCACGIGS